MIHFNGMARKTSFIIRQKIFMYVTNGKALINQIRQIMSHIHFDRTS